MIPVRADHLRIFLHVLGASVWVGGQLVLATAIPVLRRTADSATVRAVARRFQQIAWPAFALLLATGVWNLVNVQLGDRSGAYLGTLVAKLLLVACSGIAAAIHAFMTAPAASRASGTSGSDERRRRALSGASAGLALVFALAAMLLGVQLRFGG